MSQPTSRVLKFHLYFFSKSEGGRNTAITKIYRAPILWGSDFSKKEIIEVACTFSKLKPLPNSEFIDGEFLFKTGKVEPGTNVNGTVELKIITNVVRETLIESSSILIVEGSKIVAWGHIN